MGDGGDDELALLVAAVALQAADDAAFIARVVDPGDAAGRGQRCCGVLSRTVASSRGVIRAGSGRAARILSSRWSTWSGSSIIGALQPDVPGQQLVEAGDGVAAGQAVEHGGDVGLGIQAIQLRGLGD